MILLLGYLLLLARSNTLIVKQTEIIPYRLFNIGFFLVCFVALTFIGPK